MTGPLDSSPMLRIILILLINGNTVAGLAAEKKVLRLGYFLAEPLVLEEKPGERLRGVVADIFEEVLAPAMNVSIEWSKFPFERLLLETENGNLDAIAFLAKNPERAARFYYPIASVGYIDPVLVMKKSSTFKSLTKARDLTGKEITVVKGLYIPPFLESAGVRWNRIDSSGNPHFQMLEMVHLNRVELAYVATWVGVSWEIARLKKKVKISGDDDFRLLRVPESRSPLYTVFSKKASSGLVKSYEKALESWGLDHYEKYLSRYSDAP